MKSDLLNPDLGYSDEGYDLTDIRTYEASLKAFGKSCDFLPVAYRSRVFFELENEKLWTRTWIPIGFDSQIPSRGDLLPFTVGFHGVHIQRVESNLVEARFNMHQHGGCRFVPEQCRTGAQTKCSIASCNYTRDSDVMLANNGDNTDLMYKFVGINPQKLKPVRFENIGSLLFVNLDPDSQDLLSDLGDELVDLVKGLSKFKYILKHKWLDCNANWKHSSSEIFRRLSQFSEEFTVEEKKNQSMQISRALISQLKLPEALSYSCDDAKLLWLFPNLVILISEQFALCILFQATAMGKNVQRTFLLAKEDENGESLSTVFETWLKYLNDANRKAQIKQVASESLILKTKGDLRKQDSIISDIHQKYLIKMLTKKHRYYWSAPIMDAGFLGVKRS